MKKFLGLLAVASLAVTAAAAHAATPKAAEDPTATVISVGTPAPRAHSAPAGSKKQAAGKRAGKAKATAKGADQGKKVQKRTRTHRK